MDSEEISALDELDSALHDYNLDRMPWFDQVLYLRLLIRRLVSEDNDPEDVGDLYDNEWLLKSMAFPTRDHMKRSKIRESIERLEHNGLIQRYTKGTTQYLHVISFIERVRRNTGRNPVTLTDSEG